MRSFEFGLRDRDAVITDEGMIFRVFGYAHLPGVYICDPEYAPEAIYRTSNPRAFRKGVNQKSVYYKFFFDEGLRFVLRECPRYVVFHEPLQRRLVGVKYEDVEEVREPKARFRRLMESPPRDALVKTLQKLGVSLNKQAGLSIGDFGVFGSLLHGFYYPRFSDIDMIVYGVDKLKKLREVLRDSYREHGSVIRNEFNGKEAIKGKRWLFRNYSAKEFLWHQKRKLIYGLMKQGAGKRTVKVEFEPVKNWTEIRNESEEQLRITREGWVRASARITDNCEAPFMPSIYGVEPIEIKSREKTEADNIQRILSYVEEFRMQAQKDELVSVEGNLETVTTRNGSFQQITLSYGPRYFDQVLKVKECL